MAVNITGSGKMVCVTGASGFIGAHLVKMLLQRGYNVRGTVRNADDEEKYGWIKGLAEGTPGSLELASADLLTPASYDAAVQGCEYVCHVATVVKLTSNDPQPEIVDPAVEGTRNVLDSVLKAKCAKRVVMTSSIAAVSDAGAPDGHTFTEDDWHKELTLQRPYPMAKTLSERHAWKVYEVQKERASKGEDGGWSFELLVVNPGLVFGELLHKSHAKASPSVIRMLMHPTTAFGVPNFYFNTVHVRDVALGHILCMEKHNAKGRYILTQEGATRFVDIAKAIKKEYPQAPVSTAVLPSWLLYTVAFLTQRLTIQSAQEMDGHYVYFSNEKARDELGIEFMPPEPCVVDTAKSLFEFGVVPPPPSSAPTNTFWGILPSR